MRVVHRLRKQKGDVLHYIFATVPKERMVGSEVVGDGGQLVGFRRGLRRESHDGRSYFSK